MIKISIEYCDTHLTKINTTSTNSNFIYTIFDQLCIYLEVRTGLGKSYLLGFKIVVESLEIL